MARYQQFPPTAAVPPPPTAGEFLEGDERAENLQEWESFGERWLRLYGSATENDKKEIGFRALRVVWEAFWKMLQRKSDPFTPRPLG